MTACPVREAHDDEARTAADVMAFGQEFGRVLSDGQVVGRAEPFAKVFASSRAVKRAVGLSAWGVLEDIALDAHIDERGRLVADTSVRRIAANLGLNTDTVTKYLSRLRDHGFVLHEEGRQVDSGRYEPCRYVLDPSACVARFTRAPGQLEPAGQRLCPKPSDTGIGPCPKPPDMVASDEKHKKQLLQESSIRERETPAMTSCWPGYAPLALNRRWPPTWSPVTRRR